MATSYDMRYQADHQIANRVSDRSIERPYSVSTTPGNTNSNHDSSVTHLFHRQGCANSHLFPVLDKGFQIGLSDPQKSFDT